MEPVDVSLPEGTAQGFCDPRFRLVAEEFVRNFNERREVGAAVYLTYEGETVVDLWGGLARPADNVPWERDTVCTVFSCTKGATAICAHILASRGLLDIEAPVAGYWPEFAQGAKADVTVRMMLDHSAGVPAFRESLRPEGAYDWDYMVSRLEAEEPWWKPGTRHGYHMFTFGWTVGELVRRVSHKALGAFLQDEVARPLGLDFWIGAPESLEERIAPVIAFTREHGDPLGEFELAIVSDRASLQARAWLNNGGFDPNGRASHAAEIGAGGGISNARGLAGIYAPLACGGSLGEVTLVDPETLTRMGQVSVAGNADATLLLPTRFALGFMKSMDNRRRAHGSRDSAILSAAAFGHVGAGGSIGFADPQEALSFGYAMNRMGPGILLNERGQALVDAAYRSLGYTTNAGGAWTR